jgi:hypothetical protein
VRIADARVASYARELSLDSLAQPSPDPVHQPLATEEATVAMVLVVGTLNFGSGFFPDLLVPPGLSGYELMALACRAWVEAEGVPSATALAAVTADECAARFGQPPDGGSRSELMALFARALNDLGALLDARYGGSATALVRQARHRGGRLVTRLAEMPFFRDVQSHDGRPVPLYKRAQLVAADLHRALDGHGLGRFDDLDQLTIFADNVVPHVLRHDGVLELTPALAHHLDSGRLLVSGSAEEVELRACAVEACRRLAHEMVVGGETVPEWQLDFALWLRGQPAAYQEPPPHRCKTVFY